MASMFGDQSYSKLPPIRKDSLKDTQDLHEETESDSSYVIDFNREGHGLVRLPPIIRVDSSLNTTKPQRESQEESRGISDSVVCSENYQDSSVDSRRFSSDFLPKQKLYSSQSDIQLVEKRRADEKRKLEENTTSDSSDYIRDSHLVKSDTHGCTISRLETDTFGERNLDHIKTTSLLNARQVDRSSRRASLIAAEPQKLHRGRRLAKSSPELSSTRKKYNSPVRESKVASKGRADIDSIAASSPGSDSINGRLQFDIPVNISPKDQESPRSPRNGKGKSFARKTEFKHKVNTKGDVLSHSSPCTPVVHLVSDDNLSPREGRQSLGDINNTIAPQRVKKTSIVSTRKKLPIRDKIKTENQLRVDGKMCPKNERLSSRATSSFRPHQPSRDGFLRPPESRTKRDSLYDLQQILSMLNTDDKLSNPSDSSKRENRSSSVYDLKEFLKMSSFGEQPASVTINSQQTNNSSGSAESLLVPRLVEPGNRRGSTYDLLEFLSQLNLTAPKTKDPSRHGSEIPANSDVSRKKNGNAPFLSPVDSESTTSTSRRSSAYDLMEFLSLSRGSQNEEYANTEGGASQTRPSLKLPINAGSEQGEPRKNSVYNLEEFLGLPKAVPTGQMVHDSGTLPAPNTPLLSPTLPSKFKFKRDSIYDLQEFLGILQRESDGKQSSGQTEDRKTGKPIVSPGLMEDQLEKDETGTVSGAQPNKNRSLSIYDLREFLSMYASQSQSTTIASQNRGRKASSISQSSIMINVSEDEFGNGSVEDVFLAVPVEGALARKRSSVSELSELLTILNDPTRKRIHSNLSSAKSTSSERSSIASPSPVSRHDSGGGKSLYDLGEFLSVLNSDDSPLRRRLSSVSDRGNCTPSALSRNDSSGGSSLYDLEEFLTIMNDHGKEESENMEEYNGQDICIPVPQLPSSERNDRITLVKRTSLAAQCTGLNSVPESTDIVGGKPNEGRRKSLGHCL